MEKEKILQRYRQEGVDEGREEVNRRGDDAGFYAMCVLALLLMIYQAFTGQVFGDVAAVLFVLAYPDSRKNMLLVVSLAMVSSGAVGNLVDRLMLGYVRDFFDFDIFGYDFPVFNVADISLVVGVLLLIVCICIYFFTPRPVTEEREKSDGEDDPE